MMKVNEGGDMLKYKTFTCIDNKGIHRVHTVPHNSTVYVDGVLVHDRELEIDGYYDTLYAIDNGSEYVLHREDGPAQIQMMDGETNLWFHLNGHTVKIEGLPIDDEDKVILKLKYAEVPEPEINSKIQQSSWYYLYEA